MDPKRYELFFLFTLMMISCQSKRNLTSNFSFNLNRRSVGLFLFLFSQLNTMKSLLSSRPSHSYSQKSSSDHHSTVIRRTTHHRGSIRSLASSTQSSLSATSSLDTFADKLKSLGTRRAYFVWDDKKHVVKASHPELEEIAHFLQNDRRDYMKHEVRLIDPNYKHDLHRSIQHFLR